MKTILSTKKLKSNQRELLLGAGISVVDYDAINIEFLDFNMPTTIENLIFTSQNGVRTFLENSQSAPFSVGKENGVQVFCVGQKTEALLEESGLKVTNIANNSAKLGAYLIKHHKNKAFHYFCGAQRRDELLAILKSSKMEVSQVKTYKTVPFPKIFKQKWDGILFFSPSGVASYFKSNNGSHSKQDRGLGNEGNSVNKEAIMQQLCTDNPLLICIGDTTAAEAKKYSDTIVVANTTTVESVIAKAVKKLSV